MPDIDYKLLARKISELATARGRGFPRFASNNPLGTAVNLLAGSVQTVYVYGQSDNLVIDKILDEVEALLTNQDTKSIIFDPIQEISASFAVRIQNSFADLTQYHKYVDEICMKAEQETASVISADPILRTAMQGIPNETPMVTLDWTPGYSVPGYDEATVVNAIHDMFAHQDAMPMRSFAQNLAGNVSTRFGKGEFVDIAVAPETIAAIVTRIASTLTDMSTDRIADTVLTVLSTTRFSRLYSSYSAGFFNPTGANCADMCKVIIEFLSTWSKLLPIFSLETTWDLSPETMQKISTNLDLMKRFIQLCVYVLTYYRRNVYRDTIVLPNRMLNKDNIDTFMGHEGASLSMLHDYIVIMFPNNTLALSTKGVGVEEVFEKKAIVEKKIEQGKLSVLSKLTYERNRIIKTSLCNAMFQFASTTSLQPNPSINLRALIDSKAQRVISGGCDPRVSVYEFLFSAFRVNQFSVLLYEALGQKFSEMLETTGDVDESRLKVLEISVVAKLISIFVMRQCVG